MKIELRVKSQLRLNIPQRNGEMAVVKPGDCVTANRPEWEQCMKKKKGYGEVNTIMVQLGEPFINVKGERIYEVRLPVKILAEV